ncbi:MAG: hypothetical protein HOP19_22070 [Acidobacteria bacterium]|nr:hypothetical protein [Acidobacteriota bacterium]
MNISVSAQTTSADPEAPARKPLTLLSLPKLAPVKWTGPDGKEIKLRGQLAFAVTQANEDDTLTGWMLYLLPDEQRELLAKHTEQPVKSIPPYLMQTNVAASWMKDTSCPSPKIETNALAFEILGGKIHFNRATLEFRETQDYLPQLVCHWTRQLNTRKQRRSIIAAINRALTGGDPE